MMCEDSIAADKPTYQSSKFNKGDSYRGVDGDRSSNYPCTETNTEADPWWGGDLTSKYVIRHVSIINRGDCCCTSSLRHVTSTL